MKPRFLQQEQPLIREGKKLITYAMTGWRRKLLIAFFILFTISIIARVLISNWDILINYNWEIQREWLIYAIITFFIDFFLVVWIWHLLVVRLANYNNLYLTVKIILSANLARRIPGMVWYIASRAVLYEEVGVSKTKISLLSGLELAFFLISGVVTTLITLPFWTETQNIFNEFSQIWLFLVILPFCALLVHPTVLEKLWHISSRQKIEQHLGWRDTLLWLILYVLSWIIGGIVLFCIINFFLFLPVSQLMTIIGIWSLAGTISLAGFLTISVIGLREITLTLLLMQILPAPVSIIIAIFVRVMWLTGELLASLISLKL